MIILITGASHTGKTALAQKLLEKYKYPYLSIDHLKMGLIRSGNTDLTPMDDNELTEYLWPIVREMIKTAIENKQNLIVEGSYIPFDWSNDFEQEYLDNIRYYCLVMSEKYIKNHFDEDITLGEIVRRSAMSKTNFCTIFNSIAGMPFKEYLNRYRIERAAELIASGEKISVAGNCCGYNDFSTFYRNFKKYMKISPSEFANKNKNGL